MFLLLSFSCAGFMSFLEKIKAGGEKMSALDKAFDMCIELGKTIARTEEYKRFKESEYKLLHDQEARTLIENLQVLQMENQKKKLAGMETTQEEEDKLKDMERIALANPLVKVSHYSNTKFHELMRDISSKIKEGITSSEK
jgi:cell fate (sporulation/competence/biofilm development) regulator YlbF (YheA/YmcA/DUF963 family)